MSRAYNVHDLIRFDVRGQSREAEVIDHWLAEFAVESLGGTADIVWHANGTDPAASAEPITPSSRETGNSSLLSLTTGGWECWGDGHHFYALFQDLLVGRGASLVHGASLAVEGRGALLFARGGVGKSSVVFGSRGRTTARFLGDDITVVTTDGRLLAFPTPFAIYPYHHDLLPPEIKKRLEGRRRAQRIAAHLDKVPLGHSVGRWARRKLMARGSRRARSIRPGYISIPARELFPSGERVSEAPADLVAYLAPTDRSAFSSVAITREDAAGAMQAVTYTELHLDAPLNAYTLASALDLRRHRRDTGSVLSQFLENVRTVIRIDVPRKATPREVQDFVWGVLDGRLAGSD
jgi:hypothetical protein